MESLPNNDIQAKPKRLHWDFSGAVASLLRRRSGRLAVLALGIILGQFIINGPCLLGKKILLPLDNLANQGAYLPANHKDAGRRENQIRQDIVQMFEPIRVFGATEIRAGRWPIWNPHQFSGVHNRWPIYSPFYLLLLLSPSPVILPWGEMIVALFAGFGVYAFLRIAYSMDYWSTILPAWIYPLSGYFMLWQGFQIPSVISTLPWMLLAVHLTVANPRGFGSALLCFTTGLCLLAGHSDIGFEVLLSSGIYALWRLCVVYFETKSRNQAFRSIMHLLGGWTLGLMIGLMHLIPTIEGLGDSARMKSRISGHEDRPPGELRHLTEVIMPNVFGRDTHSSARLEKTPQLEGAAAAYVGFIATMLLAPLAFCNRRYHQPVVFFTCTAILGVAWCSGLHPLIDVFRLPGVNMLSYNRLTFLTGMSLVVLCGFGLDALRQGLCRWRIWFAVPMATVLSLAVWSGWRSEHPPEKLDPFKSGIVSSKLTQSALEIQESFYWHDILCVQLALGALILWSVVAFSKIQTRYIILALYVIVSSEILFYATSAAYQAPLAQYFPKLPTVEDLAKRQDGRVMGVHCLPPLYGSMFGLKDVRGYDALDPATYVELLSRACEKSDQLDYAKTAWLIPQIELESQKARSHPILQLLNVKYFLFRGTAPLDLQPALAGDDYWILENMGVLPRVFVPAKVEVIADSIQRLDRMTAQTFKPLELAFVEEAIPIAENSARGKGTISAETPHELRISLEMDTPGLMILADNWAPGWKATFNGKSTRVHRVNHTLRGFVLPAGQGELHLEYRPTSQILGFIVATVGLIVSCLRCAWIGLETRRK